MADAAYIPHLWQMIDAAQQKLQPSRDQVSAWERASGMLSNHASRLQDCRAQLAALWPPEQNAASAAYMAELDRLIVAAQQTSTAAQNNATHIGHVADAIDQARGKLKPIYDEYVKNQAALADYQKQVEKAGDVGGLLGGAAGQKWGLGALGRKAGDFLGENAMETFTSPPVSDAQQAALVARARAVQVEVDGAARDGSNRVQPPPEYLPPRNVEEQESKERSAKRSRARIPPEVNPPPHRRGEPEDTDKPGYIEGTSPPDLHTEHTPTNVTTPIYPPDGPSLTGVTPPTTTLPGPTLPPAPPVPTPPPTVTPGLPIGPPLIGGPPVGPISTGGVPRGPGGTGKVGLGPTALSAGVPPGGVIGAKPGGNVGGVPGGSGRAGGAPRANPVGGVIGQSGQGAGRPGAAGAAGGAGAGRGSGTGRAGAAGGSGSSGMVGSQRGRKSGDEQDTRHWDPDNPWAVEEGVAPEIEPNRTVGRHEPGTGVIGKDR
ncbi:hypothetical protein I0C86_18285 [Plantactinospora sp. S1510]|uniref:PPE family domain-containing protein n=1 Tax=Plantactinospora alkalitolerans TaxID=2789879 RepID=A0ABS0GXR5_9ACTN|nr:hypothetical protein [Plantactinospora alkalitolerans]MBF9130891.1 hypothetical protein [Plantactinospora alkalitolerans]